MRVRSKETVSPDKQRRPDGKFQTVPDKGDDCRCKETSQMTPRELLKLMINDLAFWKKAKKG